MSCDSARSRPLACVFIFPLLASVLNTVSAQEPAPPETVSTIPLPPAHETAPAPDPAEAQPLSLREVLVTGSRIRRSDFETAQPVLVVSKEDIERTGLSSVGDLLQELAVAGSALGTLVNNGGTGTVEVDLRNLGSNRVLVLVNGHRWVNGLRSLSTSSVDLTTIPISIIERIEVLKDGASAIYGSDAIAGVINIVTRKDYDEIELRTYFAQYEQGDGLTMSHNASVGQRIGAGTFFVDLNYTEQQGVLNSAREITRLPAFGTGVSRGSGATPAGHFQFIPTPATAALLSAANPANCDGLAEGSPLPGCDVTVITGTSGDSAANLRPFAIANDSYNYQVDNYLVTPNERYGAFAQVNYPLLSNVVMNGEFLYNVRKSAQQLAPQPILAGDLTAIPPFKDVYVSSSNPFNPTGQDIGRGAGGQLLAPGSGIARRRPVEYGPRLFSQTVDTLRAGLNFGGPLELSAFDITRTFTWDLGFSYASSKQEENTEGLFNMANLGLALGPLAACNAASGCVPFDMFGGPEVETVTPEMLDYVTYNAFGTTEQSLRNAYLNVSTELFEFFDNGPVGLALGFEYRDEAYDNQPDVLVQQGISSTNRAKPTGGGYDVKEFYGELALPLVRDFPLVRELDLSIAGRMSQYAKFGTSETGKIGLRYKPIDDLLLRGTLSSAFRAPNLGELFLGNSDSFPGIVDYCSADIRSGNPNANANCTADGVNPTYADLLGQGFSIFRGNPDLKPETADTMTAGFVYSPGFLHAFNFYVDWYRIKIKDYITPPGEQFVVDSCYDTPPDERALCEYVNRDPTSGAIAFIDNPFLNFARLETEGVDFTMDYVLPFLEDWGLGRFKLTADASYLTDYSLFYKLPGGREVRDEDRAPGKHIIFESRPRWKGNVALDWTLGGFNASYSVRYIHEMFEKCFDGLGGDGQTLAELGLCSHPDTTTVVNTTQVNPITGEIIDTGVPDDDATATARNENALNLLPTTLYHNVQLGYHIKNWGTKLTFGINNVMNQDPPPAYSNSPVYSFEPTSYEIPGRFGYLRLQQNF